MHPTFSPEQQRKSAERLVQRWGGTKKLDRSHRKSLDEILAAIPGEAPIEMIAAKWKTPNGKDTLGLLMLTPRRIIYRGRLVFDQGAKMVPIEQVVSVSSSKGMLLGSLQIGVMGEDWNLTQANKDDAARFADAVQDLLHHREQQQSAPLPPPRRAESMSDELAKLAGLHQSGVLSDTEFAQAKQRLLTGQ